MCSFFCRQNDGSTAVREKESLAVASGAARGASHPQASAASMEATKDTHQNKAPGVLGHRPPPPPADGEIGRHGHQRPTGAEENQDVVAFVFPWDHQQQSCKP